MLMRAWQVQGAGEPIDVLHAVELDPPEPGPGQVRIRVTAAGIGLPDVFMCRGTYPLTPPLPFRLGPGGNCGTVTAVGEGVALSIGARIMCVTAVLGGTRLVRRGVPGRGGLGVPRPRWPHRYRGGGVLDPAPHRVDRARRSRRRRGRRLAGRARRGRWKRDRCRAARPRARGAGHRGRERRRAGRVLPRPRRRRRDQPPRRPDRAGATRGRPAATASTSSTTPSAASLAEDAAGAMARDGRLLAVGFASGAWPKLPTHDLVTTNTSLVGVFAGGYSRDELDGIHANLAGLVGDGRLRNAVTAEVPFDDAARRAATHGGPSCGRQARAGAVTAMTKPSDFDLDAEEIVTAAVEIFEESGLDAVSMRSVSSRLGVSPVPLYSRIGNKDALRRRDRRPAPRRPGTRHARGRAMERSTACGGRGSSAPGCAGRETAGSSSGRDATRTSRHRDRSSRRCDATASRPMPRCRPAACSPGPPWVSAPSRAASNHRRAAGGGFDQEATRGA